MTSPSEPVLHPHFRNPSQPITEEVQHLAQQFEAQRRAMEAHTRELVGVQQQLQQYRDRYVDLYDSAPIGYVTMDEDGYVQEINLTGARLLGVDRDAVIGYPLVNYVHSNDRKVFIEHVRQCIGGRREVTTELILVAKDGRAIAVQLASMPLADAGDEIAFCKSALSDITQRKRAEEQLKSLNETLEQRVAQRTAEAQQRAAQLQALAVELSQAEQRERHRVAEILRDHLEQLLIAARIRLSGLRGRLGDPALGAAARQVEEILERSIGESRSLSVELSPPVLEESNLGEGLIWLARHMREKYGLTVEVDTGTEARYDPPDEGARVFLFQAVRQLLLNVVQHAQTDRAWIRMGVAQESAPAACPLLQIEVRDRGAGFDTAGLKRRQAPAGGAFGLLSIRQRLELLGGRLEIHSQPGQGSRVVIVAPIERPAEASCEQPTPPSAAARADEEAADAEGQREAAKAPPGGGVRLVVADDHPIVRKGLVELLKETPQIEVVGEAGDGEEAVLVTLRLRPDVVLMDVSMPKLNGIEATRRIKARLSGVRVVGLSMYDDGEMTAAMHDAGVSVYLSKAAPPEALIAAVMGK